VQPWCGPCSLDASPGSRAVDGEKTIGNWQRSYLRRRAFATRAPPNDDDITIGPAALHRARSHVAMIQYSSMDGRVVIARESAKLTSAYRQPTLSVIAAAEAGQRALDADVARGEVTAFIDRSAGQVAV